MDVDAFIAVHRSDWQRLDDLVGRRRLDGAESDELLVLYQRVSTHLSIIRSVDPERPFCRAEGDKAVGRYRLTALSRGAWSG